LKQILIVYDSVTGNTEIMANSVAEGIPDGFIVKVQRVTETTNDDLLNSDGIIIGSPTYYGLMSGKVKTMFDKSVEIHGKLEGKVGAAFTSAGGTATGAETTILSIIEALLVHGIIVQGRAHNKHYGAASYLDSDEDEKRYCRELGERVADLINRLND
jgi:NAD(P)H dehydrogenase (quinone)